MELFLFTDRFEGLRFSAKWVYSLNRLRMREIKSHEKEAAPPPPPQGPYHRLVWEVATFCHLRNCLQFCPLDCVCTLCFRPAGIPFLFQYLPAASIYPSTDNRGYKECCSCLFQEVSAGNSCSPMQALGMASNLDGKGRGENDDKWWGRVGDLPLVLGGLFFSLLISLVL